MYITKCDTKGCEEKIQDLCPEIMEGGWCKVQIERLKLQPRDKTLHLCDQHTKHPQVLFIFFRVSLISGFTSFIKIVVAPNALATKAI